MPTTVCAWLFSVIVRPSSAGSAVEAAAPQTIADDRNAFRRWLVLAWSERSAALCLNADGFEHV